MNAMTKPVQRPRLVRDDGVDIDDKMATLFVDRAMQAAAADLAADKGVEASLRLHSIHSDSLDSLEGQRRFLKRMVRKAGCSTMYLAARPDKKHFLMIRDILYVFDNRLTITRTTVTHRQGEGLKLDFLESFVISRHALIRAVRRYKKISSVEDVFGLLKIMWRSIERLTLTLGHNPTTTTAGTTRWTVPMLIDKTVMGLLVARPEEDGDLSLVTIKSVDMLAESLAVPFGEFLRALHDKTMSEKTRDDTLLAILPRLVV